MQYQFRYRPQNEHGEVYFDCPAVADVAPDDVENLNRDSFASIHLNGVEVTPSGDDLVGYEMFWDMVDALIENHKDDIIRVLRIARVDRVTAALCAVGIYSTLAFQTLQIA